LFSFFFLLLLQAHVQGYLQHAESEALEWTWGSKHLSENLEDDIPGSEGSDMASAFVPRYSLAATQEAFKGSLPMTYIQEGYHAIISNFHTPIKGLVETVDTISTETLFEEGRSTPAFASVGLDENNDIVLAIEARLSFCLPACLPACPPFHPNSLTFHPLCDRLSHMIPGSPCILHKPFRKGK